MLLLFLSRLLNQIFHFCHPWWILLSIFSGILFLQPNIPSSKISSDLNFLHSIWVLKVFKSTDRTFSSKLFRWKFKSSSVRSKELSSIYVISVNSVFFNKLWAIYLVILTSTVLFHFPSFSCLVSSLHWASLIF